MTYTSVAAVGNFVVAVVRPAEESVLIAFAVNSGYGFPDEGSSETSSTLIAVPGSEELPKSGGSFSSSWRSHACSVAVYSGRSRPGFIEPTPPVPPWPDERSTTFSPSIVSPPSSSCSVRCCDTDSFSDSSSSNSSYVSEHDSDPEGIFVHFEVNLPKLPQNISLPETPWYTIVHMGVKEGGRKSEFVTHDTHWWLLAASQYDKTQATCHEVRSNLPFGSV